MHLGAVDAKGAHRVEHQAGEEAGAIRIEEALEATPDTVVVDQADLVGLEPEHVRVVASRPLVHRVQRLMGEGQIADHDADRLGRCEAHPAIGCGHVLVEQPDEAETGEKVVDHGQRPERLCLQPERTLRACLHVPHCIQCRT